MPQMSHAQMEYVGRFSLSDLMYDYREGGLKKAILRTVKSIFSTLVYALYILYPVILIAATVFGVYRRDPVVLAISISILAYTFITGYTAFCESRRNVVFLPALIYAFGLVHKDLQKFLQYSLQWIGNRPGFTRHSQAD